MHAAFSDGLLLQRCLQALTHGFKSNVRLRRGVQPQRHSHGMVLVSLALLKGRAESAGLDGIQARDPFLAADKAVSVGVEAAVHQLANILKSQR